MNILQSLISLIQSQIHHPVGNFQHRRNKRGVSLLSMKKSLSRLKVRLMNSIAIKLHAENQSSRLFNAEERAAREQILKIFAPDLIK